MLTLTKAEAVKKAVEVVGSYDLVRLPQHPDHRTDIVFLSIVTDQGKRLIFHFIVVWKNSKGTHCKTEAMENRGSFCFKVSFLPVENTDEIRDVIITKIKAEDEKRTLH